MLLIIIIIIVVTARALNDLLPPSLSRCGAVSFTHPQSGETVTFALVLSTVLGLAVWGGLAFNVDSALTLMGLPDPNSAAGMEPEAQRLAQLARDFLVIR